MSSASSPGHSNQSVDLKESSRHNVGLTKKWSQHAVLYGLVKSTVMLSVLLVNLAWCAPRRRDGCEDVLELMSITTELSLPRLSAAIHNA